MCVFIAMALRALGRYLGLAVMVKTGWKLWHELSKFIHSLQIITYVQGNMFPLSSSPPDINYL